MVIELKLRKVGNSVGVILPKAALTLLNLGEGDTVVLSDTTDGGLRLTGHHPDFARKLEVAQKIARRYRNALRELAK